MPTSPPTPPQGVPSISLDEVRVIARLLHEADLSEIEIENLAPNPSAEEEQAPRVRLQLRRGTEPTVMRRASASIAPASPVKASAGAGAGASGRAAATGVAAGESAAADEVLSPTVGVFRAASPTLAVGDEVRVGQKAGAVESLKIPTDILFERAGHISAVLVEEGVGVEYGQPLFRVSGGD